MLEHFIQKITNELEISKPKSVDGKSYELRINQDVSIQLSDLKPGISMYALIRECPERKKEDLFIWLSKANMLGQGTGGARIGLEENEKYLTLLHELPYEVDYKLFKELIEDFVNYLIYWREELAKFEKEESII
jgi:hypothetical protein